MRARLIEMIIDLGEMWKNFVQRESERRRGCVKSTSVGYCITYLANPFLPY